jgi:hypothetical protein
MRVSRQRDLVRPALQEVRPVLREGLPTARHLAFALGVPQAYPKGSPDRGDWRTRRALGFPQSLSGEATQATSFDRCGDWLSGSQGTFSGEASPEKLPPRCRRNAFGQGRMWRQATGVPDSRKAWPFPLGRPGFPTCSHDCVSPWEKHVPFRFNGRVFMSHELEFWAYSAGGVRSEPPTDGFAASITSSSSSYSSRNCRLNIKT